MNIGSSQASETLLDSESDTTINEEKKDSESDTAVNEEKKEFEWGKTVPIWIALLVILTWLAALVWYHKRSVPA